MYCTMYEEIRLAHKIDMENLFPLSGLVTFNFGCYIREEISTLDTS